MPRAEPVDPLVESYTRQRGKKLTYVIEASRTGGFRILLDGQVIETGSSGLQGFPGHRTPSAKRQLEAMESAKLFIEARGDGGNW